MNNLQQLPLPASVYTIALAKFKDVVDQCGGLYRGEHWQQALEEFFDAYALIGKPITPKVHLLIHVPLYFETVDELSKVTISEDKLGLAWMGEQAIEASHHVFRIIMERFNCVTNKSCALLEGVVDFNFDNFFTF